MFKNLFGKKNDGFFMQMDESQPAQVESKAPEKNAEEAKAKPAAAAKFKNPFGKKDDGAALPAAADKTEAVVATSAIVTDEAISLQERSANASGADPAAIVATPKATKTSVKDKKKQEKEGKKDGKVAQSPEKVAAAAPIAAPAQVFTNFATDYLIQPSSNGNRRRPGANMKNFVDMAREVKVKK